MSKKIIFSLLVLYIQSVSIVNSYAMDNAVLQPRQLVKLVQDDKISLEKKRKAIRIFSGAGCRLSPETAKSLLASLIRFPKLHSDILRLIISSDVKLDFQDVQRTLKNIVNKHNRDVDFLSDLLFTLRVILNDPDNSKFEQLEISVYKNNNDVFKKSLRNGFLPISANRSSLDFLIAKLKEVSKDDQALIIKHLGDNLYLPLIREKEVAELSELCKNKDSISELIGKMLFKVVHHKNEDNTRWIEWWNEHGNSLDIYLTAISTAKNKKTDTEDRLFAMEQLIYYVDISTAEQLWNVFERILADKSEKIVIRRYALAGILDIFDLKNLKKPNRDDFRKLLRFVLNEKSFYGLLFTNLDPNLYPQIRESAQSILTDESSTELSKGFAAFALGNLESNKKKTAKIILKFLKSLPSSNSRAARLAIISLRNLTKQDHGTDIKAWQKAIDTMPDDQQRK